MSKQSLDDLVQKLGDICHEHYLGCGQNKAAPDGYEYSYDNEVINLLDSPEAKQAIVEAVEGLIDQPIDIFITNDLPSLLDGGETAAMYYDYFRKKLRQAIKEWQ